MAFCYGLYLIYGVTERERAEVRERERFHPFVTLRIELTRQTERAISVIGDVCGPVALFSKVTMDARQGHK